MQPRKRKLKSGKIVWDARWIGPTGKERSHTCSTQREAKRYVADREKEVTDGTAVDTSKMTVLELAELWRDCAENDGTRTFRNQLTRNLGNLAGVKIQLLKPAAVREWNEHLRKGRPWVKGDKGVSDNYRRNLLSQLKAMFNRAVDDEILMRNPAAKIKIGSRPDESVSPDDLPTADEVREMIELKRFGGPRKTYKDARGATRWRVIQRSESMATAIQVLAATGCRLSECAGLTWDRVNFRRSTIRIDRQMHRYKPGELLPLKTGSKGIRTISVDAETMGALRKLKDRHEDETFCFVNYRGRPLVGRDIYQAMKTIAVYMELGIPMSPKLLRHYHASLLLSKGVSIKTVQERLGHATPMRTLTTYAHVLKGDDTRAAEVFAASVFSRDLPVTLQVVGNESAG